MAKRRISHKKARKSTRRPKPTMSQAARLWVSRKIRKIMREGKKQKQAIAIALSMARKRGYKVPRKKARGR